MNRSGLHIRTPNPDPGAYFFSYESRTESRFRQFKIIQKINLFQIFFCNIYSILSSEIRFRIQTLLEVLDPDL
jgi:hypothetical protein